MEEAHKPASTEGGIARGEKFTKGTSSSGGGVKGSPTPLEDDEGNAIPADEVKGSMEQAYVSIIATVVVLCLT